MNSNAWTLEDVILIHQLMDKSMECGIATMDPSRWQQVRFQRADFFAPISLTTRKPFSRKPTARFPTGPGGCMVRSKWTCPGTGVGGLLGLRGPCIVREGGAGASWVVITWRSAHTHEQTDTHTHTRLKTLPSRMNYVYAVKFGNKMHQLSASNLFCIFSLSVKRDQCNSQILSIRYQQFFITRNQLMCTLNG